MSDNKQSKVMILLCASTVVSGGLAAAAWFGSARLGEQGFLRLQEMVLLQEMQRAVIARQEALEDEVRAASARIRTALEIQDSVDKREADQELLGLYKAATDALEALLPRVDKLETDWLAGAVADQESRALGLYGPQLVDDAIRGTLAVVADGQRDVRERIEGVMVLRRITKDPADWPVEAQQAVTGILADPGVSDEHKMRCMSALGGVEIDALKQPLMALASQSANARLQKRAINYLAHFRSHSEVRALLTNLLSTAGDAYIRTAIQHALAGTYPELKGRSSGSGSRR